ncbi:hypothetical protein HBI13_109650 [Parastagonospora nodorum]|nr:hypothetical protein HBI10_141350 [Parastagonospora nodorum]KAH4020988.1 hypothetical protein HBI13_109650 [Parastagonospora nodorum]KAH4898976.1 hypothetical protein HBH74_187230 [Parastagonospora nodorum]KAH4947261.1 hypothetical protein HBH73_135200 [Parastagonospora nodorum]KAH5090364.1 hypothetical protein HBH72_218340 [Parastagonospora nodorum]
MTSCLARSTSRTNCKKRVLSFGCLGSCGIRYNLLAPEWLDNEPGVWTKDWTEFWTGRFRKVSIDVVVHTNPDLGDASTKFVRLAEMLATRLVGLGGTVTWKDSYTAYPDIGSEWIRCVTVERKA